MWRRELAEMFRVPPKCAGKEADMARRAWRSLDGGISIHGVRCRKVVKGRRTCCVFENELGPGVLCDVELGTEFWGIEGFGD
jgi:hypothetical protein